MPRVRKAERPVYAADRHASRFLVRLPEALRQQLRQLAQRTRRPVTTEVCLAVEAYLSQQGLWPPTPS